MKSIFKYECYNYWKIKQYFKCNFSFKIASFYTIWYHSIKLKISLNYFLFHFCFLGFMLLNWSHYVWFFRLGFFVDAMIAQLRDAKLFGLFVDAAFFTEHFKFEQNALWPVVGVEYASRGQHCVRKHALKSKFSYIFKL